MAPGVIPPAESTLADSFSDNGGSDAGAQPPSLNSVDILQKISKASTDEKPPSCQSDALYNELLTMVVSNLYDPSVIVDPSKFMSRDNCDIDTDEEAVVLAAERVRLLGDPYTRVLDEEGVAEFNQRVEGTEVGIGIELAKSPDILTKGPLEIAGVVSGSPADIAGIKPGDRIVKVNSLDVTDDLQIMTMHLIEGRKEAGTPVWITVERDGKQIELKLTREVVELNAVHAEMLDGNIGYLLVDDFIQEDTSEEFQAALEKLKAAGAESYIVDLRNNPGGSLDETLEIASLFVGDGTLTTVRQREPTALGDPPVYSTISYTVDSDKDQGEELLARPVERPRIKISRDEEGEESTGERPSQHDGAVAAGDEVIDHFDKQDDIVDAPVVVLVNRDSASASELLAGALHDNDVATVIGEQTFGKGVAQTFLTTQSEEYGVKVTMAQYYSPDGNWYGDGYQNRIGLTPDVVIPMGGDVQFLSKNDIQLHVAEKYLLNVLKP